MKIDDLTNRELLDRIERLEALVQMLFPLTIIGFREVNKEYIGTKMADEFDKLGFTYLIRHEVLREMGLSDEEIANFRAAKETK